MIAWHHKLTAFTVAAVPLYLWRMSFFGLPATALEVLVLALVISGLLIPAVRRQWRSAEKTIPLTVSIFVSLFIIAALASALISEVPRVSFGIFKSWIILPILLGWVVYASANIKHQAASIKRALIISGVAVSLLSLIQFQWGQRLAGLYDVPNSLALYVAPLLVFSVAHSRVSSRWRVGYICAAIIMGLALLATQSIAGLGVAVLISSGLVVYHVGVTSRLIPVLGTILFLAALSSLFLLHTGRLAYLALPATAGEANSISVRLQLWSIGLELIRNRPLSGVGLGQFEPAYQQKLHERFQKYEVARQFGGREVAQPLREFVYRDPHNWILSFWLNTSLLGLLSFMGLHMYIFWQTRRLLATSYKLQAATAALVTLLVFGLVDTIYWKNDLAALHWILLALIWSAQVPKSAPALEAS